MIVISAALVVVALILLVIGLVDSSLTFIYASIGVSLASFAFLIVGILQRRKEELPGAEAPGDDTSEGVTTLPAVALTKAPAESAAPAGDGLTGSVLVVEGRPRYHVEGCRYLANKDAQTVDVATARADGYTACGVCKPDDSLAASASPEPAAPVEEPEAVGEKAAEPARVAKAPARTSLAKPPAKAAEAAAAAEPAAEPAAESAAEPAAESADEAEPAVAAEAAAPAKTAKAPAKAPSKAPAKKAPAKAATTAAAARAAKAPAAKAPAKTSTKTPAAKPAAATEPAKGPAKQPAKKAPAKAAAAKAAPAKRGGVVVIPDRDKFHTPDCRYVRGAEGTEELTKAAATRQGYVACGVCNP